MNSKEIFAMALGLQSPWELRSINFEQTAQGTRVLEIEIGFQRGSKFEDEEHQQCGVYDSVERSWRHLNFFQHECYLRCQVPRIKTSKGKVRQVAVPWARMGSGFTLLFEAFAMSLIEQEMPLNGVGAILEEYPNRIWTIFNHWIGVAYDEQSVDEVSTLGIDETSTKKGHNYVTVAVDMDTHRVVHATPGKDASTITKISEHLAKKGCSSDQIKQVCIDLSPSFISGVSKEFEKASITFDRFHVKQLLNKAMDEVRKQQAKEHDLLKGHKYTFLRNNRSLSNSKIAAREELIEVLPKLGEAYRLKVLFDDFWEMRDGQEAAGFLAFWCDLAQEAELTPFIKFAQTVNNHWMGILNYIYAPISNGVLEGINSKIQLAKRRARGYRNIENFINMIYFIAGKLQFNYPHRST